MPSEFRIETIGEGWPEIPAEAGAGLAALLDSTLRQARIAIPAEGLRGHLWIADRWQAEILVAGERRAEEASFALGHHLLFRLAEFAAVRLGGALPEAVARGFEDLRTTSPAALLAYVAGLGGAGARRAALWRRAFELDPNLTAARTALARDALARGETEAAAGLVAGLEVHDAAAAAELGLGLWAAASDPAEAHTARELLQQAVRAQPDDALAAAALAALLARQAAGGAAPEALDEALLLATHATQLASDDYRSWAALADVHRAAGDYRQAGFYYGFALRLEPQAPHLLKDAAANWLFAREPRQALPLIQRGLEAAPGDADHFGNLALAHDLMGETEAAAAAARRALELRPGDARIQQLCAEIEARRANPQESDSCRT